MDFYGRYFVTPFVGVWIETYSCILLCRWQKSHPSWVCGLKLLVVCISPKHLCHTLRGCVDWNRIAMTLILLLRCHTLRGCVDWNLYILKVYIEKDSHTLRGCVDWNCRFLAHVLPWFQSHPSWVCGLKLIITPAALTRTTSHPSWVCGLKLFLHYTIIHPVGSHPSWVCGLKPAGALFNVAKVQVTPFVGVWIETPTCAVNMWRCESHTLRGCVDWNVLGFIPFHIVNGHTLRGCVDWNVFLKIIRLWLIRSHTLRGCVDWNFASIISNFSLLRHTLRGCVDWNWNEFDYFVDMESHTLRGCVDWNVRQRKGYSVVRGHTLRGCVDWNLAIAASPPLP